MQVSKEDYLKHWGIKGMKWKDTKDAADAEYRPYPNPKNDSERRTWINNLGDSFLNGENYPNVKPPAAKTSAAERKQNEIKAKQDLQKQANARLAQANKQIRANMTSKIKSIPATAITKGKSFLKSLFSKPTPISKVNATRRANNSTRQ